MSIEADSIAGFTALTNNQMRRIFSPFLLLTITLRWYTQKGTLNPAVSSMAVICSECVDVCVSSEGKAEIFFLFNNHDTDLERKNTTACHLHVQRSFHPTWPHL